MERKNKYRLKVENFWRSNRDLILLIGIAAVFGAFLAAFNTWNYQTTVERFVLEDNQIIDNNQNANFNFEVDNPTLISSATIELTIEGGDAPLTVYVNGEEIDSISEGSTTVSIPNDVIEAENSVSIRRDELAFQTQTLTHARVEASTNFQQLTFVGLNFAAILLIFLPIGAVKYRKFQKRKKIEEEFPSFLRDIVEGVRAGMSLPQAIKNTKDGSYGELDPLIDKMSSQIEWGIPFDQILREFSNRTGSPMVKRSVDTIIQAYSSGGDVEEVLESVGDNLRSMKQLKEERQSQLYGEMITGYVVFFIFISILIALTTYLLPNLAEASESLGGQAGGVDLLGDVGGDSLQENIALYEIWFTRLVFIQAFFSGLIIGKLSEGEMKAGLKHIAILFAIGYISTTFFL